MKTGIADEFDKILDCLGFAQFFHFGFYGKLIGNSVVVKIFVLGQDGFKTICNINAVVDYGKRTNGQNNIVVKT